MVLLLGQWLEIQLIPSCDWYCLDQCFLLQSFIFSCLLVVMILMIDGCQKCNHQLHFKLYCSYVIDRRSNLVNWLNMKDNHFKHHMSNSFFKGMFSLVYIQSLSSFCGHESFTSPVGQVWAWHPLIIIIVISHRASGRIRPINN